VDKILRLLGSRAKFITVDLPAAAINEQYTLLEEEYRQTFGTAPEGEEWLDAYAQQYYGVSDCYEVLAARVKAKLVVFYIFRHAGLKISDEEMERAYRDYVDGLIASAGGAELYDEDHFVRLYTKEELYRRARTALVQEMVGDYLLSHNNLIEKAE
jgi:FKBP-type peptidyl-prolyl cis-trans isomerase (trigger factor)